MSTKSGQLHLDHEGLLLVHGRDVTPFLLAVHGGAGERGVGAIDVQLAWLVRRFLENTTASGVSRDEALLASVRDAVKAGYAFSSRALQLEHDDYYAPPLHLPDVDSVSQVLQRPSQPLESLTKSLNDARRIGEIVTHGSIPDDASVNLRDANWYLDNFITINKDFGTEITRLKQRLREYRLDKRARRPFVIAVCGEPGAGKSTLAERLATVMEMEPVFDNAAQWSSSDDLFHLCERMRSVHMRRWVPMAFIDEVDVRLQGDGHLYGKLLAPIWDGAFYSHGERREVGTPSVFLLAGSGGPWRRRQDLLNVALSPDGTSKLADLVSRLTVQPIEVPSLFERSDDIVYLVAFHLVNRFPRLKKVDEGIFRLLAQSVCKYGSRSVGRVLDLITSPKDETHISVDDLPVEREHDLRMFLDRIPRDWRGQKQRTIQVSP